MEAPILRWSQRSFKNHSLVSENGCLGMHGGIRVVYRLLETIFPALFHTARTLSGSLRSPPSPRGEGFVSEIALPPSNLRPFGAPPSIGRRECPREPLPLEGAAERSEAGLASFLCGARVLSYNRALETISPLFHTARTLSGSLRSPPSPRGEGFAGENGILVSSSIPRKNDRLLRAVVFMCITCYLLSFSRQSMANRA